MICNKWKKAMIDLRSITSYCVDLIYSYFKRTPTKFWSKCFLHVKINIEYIINSLIFLRSKEYFCGIFKEKKPNKNEKAQERVKNATHLKKPQNIWITTMRPLSNSSKMTEITLWNRHLEFSRGRHWAGRGPKNPNWWFIHS